MTYTLFYSKDGQLAFPVDSFRALKRRYARKKLAAMAERYCHDVPEDETHYILAVNEREEILAAFDIEPGAVCGELCKSHNDDFILVCW